MLESGKWQAGGLRAFLSSAPDLSVSCAQRGRENRLLRRGNSGTTLSKHRWKRASTSSMREAMSLHQKGRAHDSSFSRHVLLGARDYYSY